MNKRKKPRLGMEEIHILSINMTDDETEIFLNKKATFTQKRQIIAILNKYLPPSKSNK